MAPAVVPVEHGGGGDGGGGGGAEERAAGRSCHVAWLAWWERQVRCLVASTLLLRCQCHAALGSLSRPAGGAPAAVVRGTFFLPSAGDRRVRLFLHEHSAAPSPSPERPAQTILVLDLPAGLAGADIAAAGRIVLECQRQWSGAVDDCRGGGAGSLLDSPKWLVYCNGRRVGFAARREAPSDAEGWVLEKLWAVTAGAGRLPGGAGVEYLRGRFERTVASSDAESFHLVDPIGWLGFNGNDGLSIFFHRI
ncbi:protein MIZU-KUSSEI 1-like [Oryza brachyantha]|uniref:protein MIZU-KUSSEI 1-like n=1 Tax=Oryza brachyantha TaxID=4533 RepID=UPI001ADC7B1F|nr:protein MIZU-KUSSEI 1-like [Oryza brachyantha]